MPNRTLAPRHPHGRLAELVSKPNWTPAERDEVLRLLAQAEIERSAAQRARQRGPKIGEAGTP